MYHSDKLADLIVVEPLAPVAPRLKKEADPFSLDALIVWLEKQSGETKYSYTTPSQCLVAQAFGLTGLFSHEIDTKCFPGAANIAADHPWTFGAALTRALALRGDR